METKIRKIGNSSGIILPKSLIDKYDLSEVIIEDHGDGIIIKPAKKSMFQAKMEEARKNKKTIYLLEPQTECLFLTLLMNLTLIMFPVFHMLRLVTQLL